ncbi:hypothetical protein QTQ03_23960 [Micromonospora sp. WMMA1363]|uniref:hypothetical protein n=1 Tax=Micromonospora sp. WMMA1363 TaxID=3053985 RepID=UPI00259CADC7|nr:hypothetical protein [Micromonospora sp. WMMA1363]MDM4722495.1 hypothetical protein [Micromonospora sp. WMMA1363]
MNIRRWSVGVLAATLIVPGLAACDSGSGEPGVAASSAASADLKEVLLAATKEIEKGNFAYTIAGDGLTGKGLVHKPSNSATLSVSVDDGSGNTFAMDLIHIAPDSWVRVDFGELAASVPALAQLKDKYQHLDQTKIKNSDSLGLNLDEGVDPAGADALLRAVADVRKTGEGTYTGTLDASGVTESSALDSDLVKALGDQAKALSFTAKLDSAGRLVELVVPVPAAGESKAHDVKITYADYGAATAAQKPPADQVIDASDQTYEMFR